MEQAGELGGPAKTAALRDASVFGYTSSRMYVEAGAAVFGEHGILPAARGAGGITRRVIGTINPDSARLGVSSLVRALYRYWTLFGEPDVPWPAVTMAIEEELGI